MSPRAPTESAVETAHMVLPGDTNVHGTAFGGRIMQWMDITAAIAAGRHCGGSTVTAAVDDMVFARPIRMGDVVLLKACVNFTGRSSMEVGVRVDCEDPQTRRHEHCLTGYFTFVAVDANGRPVEVPAVQPQSAVEQRRWEAAKDRRQRRLQSRPK